MSSWPDPETIREEAVCEICKKTMENPRVLPCDEEFCQDCIQDVIDKKGNKNDFECPGCQYPHPIPSDGAAGFRLSTAVEFIKKHSSPQNTGGEKLKHQDSDEIATFKINPEWNIASERPSNKVDALGYDDYAEAFAEMVLDERVPTGTAIGVYGSWGAGKTFLLDLLSAKCKGSQRMSKVPKSYQVRTRLCYSIPCNICAYLILLAFVVLGLGATFGGLVLGLRDKNATDNANVTSSPTVSSKKDVMSDAEIAIIIFFGFVGVGILAVCVKCCCGGGCKIATDEFVKLLLLMFFKRPPRQRLTGMNDKSTTSNIKVIEVRFNAWEFSGSDYLWAGIVTNLCNEVEKEFGFWKTRLYRFVEGEVTDDTEKNRTVKDKSCCSSSSVGRGSTPGYIQVSMEDKERTSKTQPQSGNAKNNVLEKRKSCLGISSYFTFLSIISIVLVLIIVIVAYAQAIPTVTREQILLGVAIVGLITALVTVIKPIVNLTSSLCQSEAERILRMKRHLTRSNFDNELGFMNRVKKEVYFIKDFIKHMECLYQTDYRLLIIIDDLDRVEKDKIHKILEAINILFSDSNLPFISLIAIDPRIVVKAIEQSYHKVLLDANINGHEYLKKIIHLPFCIPLPNEEQVKRFVGDLVKTEEFIDDVDNVANGNSSIVPDDQLTRDSTEQPSGVEVKETGTIPLQTVTDQPSSSHQPSSADPRETEIASLKTAMDGLNETRKFLLPNARNMKRIRNILMVTLKLMLRGKKKSDEEIHELARWVLLTEQWPYRASWLIHEYETRKHLPDSKKQLDTELHTVYDECKKELAKPSDWKSFLSLDHNPKLFKLFLEKYNLKLIDVERFLPVTVNLDHTIRTIIASSESETNAEMSREQLNKTNTIGEDGENRSIQTLADATKKKKVPTATLR